MTGHVGRPAPDFTPSGPKQRPGSIGRWADTDVLPPDYVSIDKSDIHSRFQEFWKTDLDPNSGLTVVEIMRAIHAGDIRAMYIMGENHCDV